MMYNSKFVVAVKVNGRVLRETNDGVTIPFGSEYSILLKNLNTVRALVTVYIDGQDIGGGTQFVVDPNSTVELERHIRNGNLSRGNRFKFIERTEQIEDARGIKADDGLIRVEYKFEKPVYRTYLNSSYRNAIGSGSITKSSMPTRSLRYTTMDYGPVTNSTPTATMCCTEASTCDVGITVPGSESNQQFCNVGWFQTESESHVIVLQLHGTAGGKAVTRPITVTVKPLCITCHKLNSPWDRFCSRCGTSLKLI